MNFEIYLEFQMKYSDYIRHQAAVRRVELGGEYWEHYTPSGIIARRQQCDFIEAIRWCNELGYDVPEYLINQYIKNRNL